MRSRVHPSASIVVFIGPCSTKFRVYYRGGGGGSPHGNTYLIRKIPPRCEAYSINVTSGFIQSRMYHRFLFSEKLNLYFKPRYISHYWIDLFTVDLPLLISPKAVLNLNPRFKKNRYVSFGRPSISQNQLITPVHAPLPLQPLIFRNGRCTGR